MNKWRIEYGIIGNGAANVGEGRTIQDAFDDVYYDDKKQAQALCLNDRIKVCENFEYVRRRMAFSKFSRLCLDDNRVYVELIRI